MNMDIKMNFFRRLLVEGLLSLAIRHVYDRPADFVVGSHADPYLKRWFVLGRQPSGKPRNWLGLLRIYVHIFRRSDDDRAHHDHPAMSVSLGFAGRAVEETIAKGGVHHRRPLRVGTIRIRSAKFAHRIEIEPGEQYWTLFIFFRNTRDWGFHCPKGWVPWWEFTAADNKGEIGRGCGEGQ